MSTAESRLIEAVKFAIQMELDGKAFYLDAAKNSGNQVGNELFSWLAVQEDHHRQTFENIYQAIVDKKGWTHEAVKPAKGVKLGTIFAEAIKQSGNDIKAKKEEIEAAVIAMDMELKSRDYYKKQADRSETAEEKNFFNTIAAEEQGHYLGLVDYKEYMTDPVDWFTRTEHHLLDGA